MIKMAYDTYLLINLCTINTMQNTCTDKSICWEIEKLNNGQQIGAKNNQHYLYACMIDLNNHKLCVIVAIRDHFFQITTPIRIYD